MNYMSIPGLRKKKNGVSKFYKILKAMSYEENRGDNKQRISKKTSWKIAETLQRNIDMYNPKGT